MIKFPPIVIDTREQRPLTFGSHETVTKRLDVGDYSIVGYEKTISVERKSLTDLFSTLSSKSNRIRFLKELARARDGFYNFSIVVEGSVKDLFMGNQYTIMNPFRLLESLLRMGVESGANIMFAGSRGESEVLVRAILRATYLAHKEGTL